jgi:uncharacterized protein (TIGR02646 family)
MIFIDRNRLDEHGKPIRPGQAWFELAEAAQEDAIDEAGAHVARSHVYAHVEVKAALEELFHDKCAYCETPIAAGSDWDVEHFRPKGRVAERAGHPGYFWLTYEWSNLYPSCGFCNKRRKDRPRWGDLQFASTEGKNDQFPLEDEATRAMGPKDDLSKEKRLLLDPCEDRPEEHLRFTIDGQVVPVTGSRKGEASIKVFHLGRRRLREQRRSHLRALVELLEKIRKYEDGGNQALAQDLREWVEKHFLADSKQYAAVARAVVRDPVVFGV